MRSQVTDEQQIFNKKTQEVSESDEEAGGSELHRGRLNVALHLQFAVYATRQGVAAQ